MVSQTNIVPGEGVGSSIRLGESFYRLVTQLNKFKYKMKIVYSNRKYLDTPITIILPELGLRLLFNAHDRQELILIEVIEFEFVRFTYNGINLNEISDVSMDVYSNVFTGKNRNEGHSISVLETDANIHSKRMVKAPTLKQVYNKIFGPTYPGRLSKDLKSYTLSYPGIAFRFGLHHSELIGKVKKLDDENDENGILSILLNQGGNKDVLCESFVIFSGSSWEEFYQQSLKVQIKKFDHVKELGYHWPSNSIRIELVKINLKQGAIKIIYQASEKSRVEECVIRIGETSQQEILNVLGSPDDYFNKFDSRLLIHNQLSHSLKIDLNDNSIYKFHNYFRYGMDFLYDLNPNSPKGTGVLKKLILHNGGLAQSLDFMRWNQCRWEILSGQNVSDQDNFQSLDGLTANSSMLFEEIPEEFLKQVNEGGNIRPVLLNRYEAELTDNDIEVISSEEVSDDALIDVAHSRDSNSSEEKNIKSKTWGQSKLYGCSRCIWEVIDSNNCISAVTIY